MDGVIYCETSTIIVKFTSIRSLFAIVTHFDLKLHHMDVVRAFLNEELDDNACMEVLEGVTGIDRKVTICKLVKDLYRLLQRLKD